MTYTVRTGRIYKAVIRLGFFEGMASNETIAAKLREAGFVDVVVNGSGRDRVAVGRWPGAPTMAELPEQIKSVAEVGR